MNNKNQKPNNSNNGNIDETVEKAKSEINAQTDSMLREIEERRQRRLARQREMEQQIQAEEEAKARRMARLKAQEAANADLKKASSNRNAAGVQKPVPTVSSSDSVFSNAHRQQSDAIDNFSSAPSSSRDTQSRTQSKERNLNPSSSPANARRRMMSSGETQVMPKISEAVPPTQRKQNTVPSNQKRAAGQNTSKRIDSKQPSGSANNEQAFKRRQVQNTVSASSVSQSAGRAPVKRGNISTAKSKNTHKEVNMMKEIRDWVIAIVVAIAVALLIRNFVFTLVKVQGESMQPTLQENDRLYVNRLFYTPKKGDVVIFKPSSDPKRPYVKRVIATEGDTVYIDFETGDIYVNDQVIDEPYIKAKTTRSGSYIAEQIASGNYSKDNPIVIEKGKIFVMGDNRNNSRDSREIGQVPKSELIGGAVFRFWPLNKFGSVSYKATTSYLIEDENMNFKFVA